MSNIELCTNHEPGNTAQVCSGHKVDLNRLLLGNPHGSAQLGFQRVQDFTAGAVKRRRQIPNAKHGGTNV